MQRLASGFLCFMTLVAVTALPLAEAAAEERQYARAQTLDLDALEDSLRGTDAIGLASKLTLKIRLDNLLDNLRDLHAGKGGETALTLKGSFNDLMDDTLGLLRDDDPALYGTLIGSRAGLWSTMIDRRKFRAAFDKKDTLVVASRRDRK